MKGRYLLSGICRMISSSKFPSAFAAIVLCICLTGVLSVDDNECENRPQPTVYVKGKSMTINEENFAHYVGIYPPEPKGSPSEGLDYFVLNREKSVLYVSNFLNTTAAEELKQFCISGQRFTRSPIRGHGDDPSVSKSEHRTR